MNPITTSEKEQQLVLEFHKRIDSSNAEEAGRIVDAALEEHPDSPVIMDFSDLEYISSAGLRLILKIRKLYPDTKVTGASTEVYEILEMTGFTEMIHVEKAYRNISVEGCELIGRGANGEVYRLDKETIIKVSLNRDALPAIHREQDLARKAFILGIPTAISYDVVTVGERYGSVFELLDCSSVGKLLSDDPQNIDELAKIFVDLLKTIHRTETKRGELPDAKSDVLHWVDFLQDHLPSETWVKLHGLVNDLPRDNHLIHGDYHGKNVMLQKGEALLIDMDTLAQGDPVIEFASIFNAYKGFSILDHSVIEDFQGIDFETAQKFWTKILQLYFGTEDPAVLQDVEDKASLLGYTRLLRRSIRRDDDSDEKARKAREFYSSELIRLTAKLSDLDIKNY